MLSIMENELDPFAEYMWMEEQEAFDRKVQYFIMITRYFMSLEIVADQ